MTVIVLEVRDGELLAELTRLAAEAGIRDGAIVSLIGAVDSFIISTMSGEPGEPDIPLDWSGPGEMTGTGEIVNGTVHIHAVMALPYRGPAAGHLRSARISTWFAHAYVIPLPAAYQFAGLSDPVEIMLPGCER